MMGIEILVEQTHKQGRELETTIQTDFSACLSSSHGPVFPLTLKCKSMCDWTRVFICKPYVYQW